MTNERTDAEVNGNPGGPTDSNNGRSRAAVGDFGRQARKMIARFPSRLDEEIRRSPYKTLGVACAAGLGAGVLLSSRVLRSVLGSAVSYAVVEVARGYLREYVAPSYGRKADGAVDGRTRQTVA